jgi:glyoxylase-like metal-dependent hydrolase (beta-lactamase superfamily II)
MTHLHFDHCGGSVQWNKEKPATNPPLKMPGSGAMTIIGSGHKTKRT